MYPYLRALLFRLPPEQAHAFSLALVRLAGRLGIVRAMLRRWFAGPELPVEVFGLRFRNPVGLAAGYDKDGLGWRGLDCLGFGHLELGTVTLRPQPGNPKPRLFRLPQDKALINRMGFPGLGAQFLAERLAGRPRGGAVIGVNLGKNKDTPLEKAVEDYLALLEIFAPLAEYLAVNVSSPNTPGLRSLQNRAELEALLAPLARGRAAGAARLGKHVPVLVKLAPDLNDNQLDDALEAILATGMDGVIATNTTLERSGLRTASQVSGEAGGLSGAPLAARSTQMIAQICRRTQGKLPVIGVGGIIDAAGARAKLDAGASLVQVYTGLVYAGPGLVKQICTGLAPAQGASGKTN